MSEAMIPSLELTKVFWDYLDGIESTTKKVFQEMNFQRIASDLIACTSRGQMLLEWNGQAGVAFEVLFDVDSGYAGCRVLQTGCMFEDALYRSLTDGSVEQKTGDAAKPGFAADRFKSQFVWLKKQTAAVQVPGGVVYGYGYFTNRADAVFKLTQKISTDAALSGIRDWRQAREVMAIERRLQSVLNDGQRKLDASRYAGELAAAKEKKQQLDRQLQAALAYHERVSAANAAYGQFGHLLGIAGAIAQVLSTLSTSDTKLRADVSSAKNHQQLSEAVGSETLQSQDDVNKFKQLERENALQQNILQKSLLDIARDAGAPKSVLQQPIWTQDDVPILKLH